MSTQYICELCSKEFKQKIDYTRHKDKKNACVTADKLKQKIEKELEKKNEQKINHNSTLKNMSTLFSSCMNILRDNESLTGDKALRNLSYLLVLKLIEPMIGSEIDLESFDYLLPEKSKPNRHKFLEYTRFSNIAASKEDDIPKLLKNIWDNILSKHPKTKDIFLTGKGFDIKKQATFRKLIDKLYEFDLSDIDYDIQGHAYEDLLKDIMTGKVLGQYFTQPLVKNMMVSLINPKLNEDGTCETIFDPAMGTGGFLMTSLRHLQKQAEDRKIDINWPFIASEGVGGRETEPDTFQLCKTNMLVSCGHMINNLQQGDSIRDTITGKYDIVLANPPFGIKGLDYKEIKNQDCIRDKYLPIESKSAVPLFLQAIISILKVGGRCAMVMPDGQELFGKGKALVALREYLMKTCELREVIYLPSGMFSNTSIKTCVLHFYKRREGSDVVEIGGKKTRTYKFSKTLQTESVKFYDYNPYEKVKNPLAEVDASRIAENNYSLNYAEYLDIQEQDDEKEYNSEVEWKTLGEVCDFNIGGTPSRKESTYWEDGKNLWVSVRELNGGYIYDTNEKITDLGVKKSSVKLFPKDTVLFSFKLSIGKTAIVGTPMYSNEAIAGINTKDINSLLNKYLYYYLTITDFSQSGVGAMSNGSLNKGSLALIKIPLPSLQVQQKIVERLEYLYETCTETATKAIEQLKTKKAMVVEMGTEGVETKSLGEVSEINPTSLKKGAWKDINYIDISSVSCGSITEIKNLTENFPSRAIRIIKEGDTIYSTVRPALRTYAYIEKNIERGVVSSGFAVIRPKENINKKYISYIMSQQSIADLLDTRSTGAQYPSVSIDVMKELKIPIPSIQAQQRIVQECERLDKLITHLEADIEADKSLANSYLKSFIESPQEDQEQEYTDIIISDEEYSETETKPTEEQQYTDIIISDEDYDEQ
jgi:type I restriction-modification system DNA methylase subunit